MEGSLIWALYPRHIPAANLPADIIRIWLWQQESKLYGNINKLFLFQVTGIEKHWNIGTRTSYDAIPCRLRKF